MSAESPGFTSPEQFNSPRVTVKSGLSAAMVRALKIAQEGGSGRLIRWPGGYWLGRHRNPEERAPISVYAMTLTVNALIARGYLDVIACMRHGDVWIVALSEKGKRVAEGGAA